MKNDDIAHAQAMNLIALACEQDTNAYISQLKSIDNAHAVVNELCRMVVVAVPYERHNDLAEEMRNAIGRLA
ncbi:hypothetical protein [uncultured Jatrophihabitans sp.]|uniref:hypothetical protein n=1 Tax=uncultured Jatrophihabitans sp. TaxID=1610747 RepID=UPI0035C9B3A8